MLAKKSPPQTDTMGLLTVDEKRCDECRQQMLQSATVHRSDTQ